MRSLLKNNTFFLFLMQSVVVVFAIVLSFALVYASPAGYEDVKIELDRLIQDKNRSAYRHNWLKLSDDFYEIYNNNANWNNRPAALFRSAYALDQMAQRSFVRKDAQSAIERYLFLVKKHKASPLADDALYNAAQLANSVLRDTKKAKAYLKQCIKDYPTGDYVLKAKKYYAEIGDGAIASLGKVSLSRPRAGITLTKINSQLKNDVVRIIISMDSISSWRAKYKDDAKRPGVVITLNNVAPSDKIELEDTFKKMGIFVGYQIEYNEEQGASVVSLEFSELLRYAVKAEKEPARLIIEVTNSSKQLRSGINVKDESQKTKVSAKEEKNSQKNTKRQKTVTSKNTAKVSKDDVPTLASKIASQLGLRVKTIVIDPGHGGKDPGAVNNGIKEKNFNLDVAKRLASVLKSAGYTVHLTRTTDKYVGLYERTDIARKYKADLFISLHANSSKNKNAEGFETYYLDFSSDENTVRLAAIENAGVEKRGLGEMEKILGDMLLKARIQESKRLASKVQQNTVNKVKKAGYKVKNNGSKGALFHVLIGSSMPCILVEMGYTSSSVEAKRMSSDKFRNSLAEGIANGIHQYATELNK